MTLFAFSITFSRSPHSLVVISSPVLAARTHLNTGLDGNRPVRRKLGDEHCDDQIFVEIGVEVLRKQWSGFNFPHDLVRCETRERLSMGMALGPWRASVDSDVAPPLQRSQVWSYFFAIAW